MSSSGFDRLEDLGGRRALVTGGSRGIGAAIARRLVAAGATVVVTARGASETMPAGTTFFAGDLSADTGARAVVASAVEHLGGLDILINNAGGTEVFPSGPETITDAAWQDALNINFLAAVRVTAAAIPSLRNGSNPSIVNISSRATTDAPAPTLHYAAAKSALATYTKGMAQALAPDRVRANLVTLGPVSTEAGNAALEAIAPTMGLDLSGLMGMVPLGRFGTTDEVAELVAYLVSDHARWMTGEDLVLA